MLLQYTEKLPVKETNKVIWYILCQFHTFVSECITRNFLLYADNWFCNVPIIDFLRRCWIVESWNFRRNPTVVSLGSRSSIANRKYSVLNDSSVWGNLDFISFSTSRANDTASSLVSSRSETAIILGELHSDTALVTLWTDQNVVAMMRIFHRLRPYQYDYIFRIRRRLKATSSNTWTVWSVLESYQTKTLPIPKIIDDFRHFMGSSDSFDQKSAKYNSRLPTRSYWIELFHFVIEVSLVNTVV